MLLPLLVASSVLGVPVAFQPTVAKQLVSDQTGQVKLQVGILSDPLPGELNAAARAWALGQRTALGLPATSTLRTGEAMGTRWGASFRLQQQVDGIDVHDAQVVVTVDALRRVTIVSSSVLTYEQSVLVWSIGADEALLRAAKAVPLAGLQSNGKPYGGVKQEIFPVAGNAHAGYLAAVPTINPADNWFVAIDAVTGEVLWKQNRVFHSAEAQTYQPSPGGLDAGVGVTATTPVTLTHDDGGAMVLVADGGGYLNGDQLLGLNCCPNQACSTGADAGPKRASGQLMLMGFSVNYNIPVCDRLQRATDNPAVHDAGTYVYPPIDPPAVVNGMVVKVSQSELSDSDEFAEVHAFYQINKVYDWVRGLSSTATPLFPANTPAIGPFKMRDERRSPPRQPAVWANVTTPDLNEIYSNPQGTCNFSTLSCTVANLGRVDNAAFMPKENFAQIPIPELAMDVDTLMIFQGSQADFGYDSPVLWHEFGHGVVYATAALTFDTIAIDARSANNETGAMHEGFADFLSASYGNNPQIGVYVGPRIGGNNGLMGVRQDAALRNLDNNLACPDVLWGEVHQDSQHYSAALWAARTTFFQGTDSGRTFDAAFYASLVSMAPDVDFAAAAAIIVAHVKTAFPTVSGADTKMQGLFTQRGVTGCSKILDMTGITTARPYYGITSGASAGFAASTIIPGPVQMKLSTPLGAKTVKITANIQAANPLMGGGAPKVSLLAKSGMPITFTRSGGALTNDADKTVDATVSGSTLTAQAAIDVPCGSSSAVFFTLGSVQGDTLQNLKVSFTPADSCTPKDAGMDAGTVDAGSGDAGTEVTNIPWIGKDSGGAGAPKGCGCSSVEAGLGGLALLGAMAARRRKQR